MEKPANQKDMGAELMLRFQAGDSRAFEEIVSHYQNTIYAFLYRFRGREEGSEDLAQEVFLRVFRSRRNYQAQAKFSTWLYHIACNLCRNEVRDKSRRISLVDSAENWDEQRARTWRDEKAVPPIENLSQGEISNQIRSCLDELPENQRAAMLLNRYHGLSYQEIGESLELSEKAVKSLMSRAREKLREKLTPYFREELRK